jgi:hypothetical protein
MRMGRLAQGCFGTLARGVQEVEAASTGIVDGSLSFSSILASAWAPYVCREGFGGRPSQLLREGTIPFGEDFRSFEGIGCSDIKVPGRFEGYELN